MGLVDNLKALLTWQAPPAPPGRKGLLDWAQQPYFVRDQYRYDPLTGTTYSTTIDYAAAAGDLGTNGIIMACIGWLMRAEPEAPWRIQRRTAQGTSAVAAHALYDLLLRPNPFYSGLALRQATCFSFNLAGNAYWLKTRNAGGRVIQLWWEPHTTIRAHWPSDGSAFIDGYEIYRGGRWWPVPAADVVHFRDGLDPTNPRYGLSRLGAALRDVAQDNEAARFGYTMLRNQGIAPVVISPKSDDTVWTPDEAALLKASFIRNHTGDERGTVMVPTAAVSVDQLSFPPDAMNTNDLRLMSEARIAALLDTPAVIVGLLVGLEHSTYSNMEQAKEHAVEGNLIPYYRTIDDTVAHQLLPDLGDPTTELVDHDLSQVRVLQADQTALYTRINTAYGGGWITRAEARQATGWPVAPDGSDAVYKDGGAALPALPPEATQAKAWTPGGTKAATLPTAERALARDLTAWLRGLYADAATDVPGKALVHTNGRHHGD